MRHRDKTQENGGKRRRKGEKEETRIQTWKGWGKMKGESGKEQKKKQGKDREMVEKERRDNMVGVG